MAPITLALMQEPGWAMGDRRRGIQCVATNRGCKGENRTLGIRGGDVGGFGGLLRNNARVQEHERHKPRKVILKTCEDTDCDIIGSQEVRRDGQRDFASAG